VERVTEKADGRVAAVAWREFHGNQTSRQREQLVFSQRGSKVCVVDGPAEYSGCTVVRIGDAPIAADPQGWAAALLYVQGGLGEVLLQRRDPPEPPAGSRALHPLVVRASLLFEDCVAGTTAMLRRSHFQGDESPFAREEAEGHWTWMRLGAHRHAANLADPLVRTRRHEGNRAQRDANGIYESSCAAVQEHLRAACGAQVDMNDAAAMLHHRGPRTTEQGEKILEVLQAAHESFVAEYVRPGRVAAGGHGDFRRDFVLGRELALERAFAAERKRYKSLVDEVSRVITDEKSPRHHRSRTPPR